MPSQETVSNPSVMEKRDPVSRPSIGRPNPTAKSRIAKFTTPVFLSALLGVSLFVALNNLSNSGPQWMEDDPQYANNAAMVRDWLRSGEWFHPIEFAKKSYAQYPSLGFPFHPPGYGLVLGIWFLIVGMSYTTGRLFVALCLFGVACGLYFILRKQGASAWLAGAASAVLVTSPEVTVWSRSMMSEIPSMALFLAASYCFLKWMDTGQWRSSLGAFGLAIAAFSFRVTTAGLLLTWPLFMLAVGRFRWVLSPKFLIPAIVYFGMGCVWVFFAIQFHTNDFGPGQFVTKAFSMEHFSVWLRALPQMVGPLTLALALIGAVVGIRKDDFRRPICFWLIWFVSYYAFTIAERIHFEARYFVYALPAICALLIGFSPTSSFRWWHTGIAGAIAVLFSWNLVRIHQVSPGLLGYHGVAQRLSQLEESGNILMSNWYHCDLIFRYRCIPQKFNRQLIRGDRTLAIRVPHYSRATNKTLARTYSDVLDVVRRGRIRYLLTSQPLRSDRKNVQSYPADMYLAHQTASSMPQYFSLIDRFELTRHQDHFSVFLWQFKGPLPSGPSELPIIIPAANMKFGVGN